MLTSKPERKRWEKAVNTHFIQPVLENLNLEVNVAMDLIANDKTQGKYAYICCYG